MLFAASYTLEFTDYGECIVDDDGTEIVEKWVNEDDVLPTYTSETACTSINDDFTQCDCIQANVVDWNGSNCGDKGRRNCEPDWYFSSYPYLGYDHDVKMGDLWAQLVGTPVSGNTEITESPKKVKCQNFDELYMHLNQAPGISMEHEGDEMPNFFFDTR